MITIFNRRELIITSNMKQQADVTDALENAGIPFSRVPTNQMASRHGISPYPNGNPHGPFGDEHQYMITFFVRRRDYEEALHVLGMDKIP